MPMTNAEMLKILTEARAAADAGYMETFNNAMSIPDFQSEWLLFMHRERAQVLGEFDKRIALLSPQPMPEKW